MLTKAQEETLKSQVELWWDNHPTAIDSLDDYVFGFANALGIPHDALMKHVYRLKQELQQSNTIKERDEEEMFRRPMEVVNDDDVFPEEYYEDPEQTVWLNA